MEKYVEILAELFNKHEASFKKLVLKKSLNNDLFQSIKKPVDIETFKKLNEKRNVTNKDKTIRRYNNIDTKVGKLEHILLFLKQVNFPLSTDEIPFIRQREDNDDDVKDGSFHERNVDMGDTQNANDNFKNNENSESNK